jgi:hypothetical protein
MSYHFSLDYAGLPIPDLYVGSWSEWSRREGKKLQKKFKSKYIKQKGCLIRHPFVFMVS